MLGRSRAFRRLAQALKEAATREQEAEGAKTGGRSSYKM